MLKYLQVDNTVGTTMRLALRPLIWLSFKAILVHLAHQEASSAQLFSCYRCPVLNSQELVDLENRIIKEEARGGFDLQLQLKKLLAEKMAEERQSDTWHHALLEDEIDALTVFCSYRTEERNACLREMNETLQFLDLIAIHANDSALTIIDRHVHSIEARFGKQNLLMCRYWNLLASAYAGRLNHDKAIEYSNKSVQIAANSRIRLSPEIFEASCIQALAFALKGDDDRSETALVQANEEYKSAKLRPPEIGDPVQCSYVDRIYDILDICSERRGAVIMSARNERLMSAIYGERSPAYAWAVIRSGAALIECGEAKAATAKAAAATNLSKAPGSHREALPLMHLLSGRIYLLAGQYKHAEESFIASEELYLNEGDLAQSIEALGERVLLNLKLSRFDEAEKVSQSMMGKVAAIREEYPDGYIEAWRIRSDVLAARRLYPAAIMAIDRAIESRINSGPITATLVEACDLQLQRAKIVLEMGETDSAVSNAKTVAELLTQNLGQNHPKTKRALEFIRQAEASEK